MTVVVIGTIADKLGAVRQKVTVGARHPGRTFDVRHRFSKAPSTEYRSVQASTIPVDVDHERGDRRGQVFGARP